MKVLTRKLKLGLGIAIKAKMMNNLHPGLSLSLSHSPALSLLVVPNPKVTPPARRRCRCRSLHQLQFHQQQMLMRRRRRGGGICHDGAGAELSQDAPFAIAIAACMLHSLLFPLTAGPSQEDEEEAATAPTDARFAVMTIISFIPFFNWLSWVFAFMDTGKRRYALYAAVYLAPYLRTNLSLSPEESWLPIASIVLCIVHIQLEASIRNGDLDAFAFFNEAAERFGLVAGSKDNHSRTQRKVNKGRRLDNMKLPSGQTQSRKWEDHRKPSLEAKHDKEDSDLDDGTEH